MHVESQQSVSSAIVITLFGIRTIPTLASVRNRNGGFVAGADDNVGCGSEKCDWGSSRKNCQKGPTYSYTFLEKKKDPKKRNESTARLGFSRFRIDLNSESESIYVGIRNFGVIFNRSHAKT